MASSKAAFWADVEMLVEYSAETRRSAMATVRRARRDNPFAREAVAAAYHASKQEPKRRPRLALKIGAVCK